MIPSHRAYRALVRLYPRAFRSRSGEDLIQQFADLAADRGTRAAWRRTAVDLVVTVPRYRVEAIVSSDHSSQAIAALVFVLALAGMASVLVGLYPGVLLVPVAGAVAIAQRSALARALSALDPDLRRRRFVTAAVSGALFVTSFVAYLLLIGDHWTVRETVLAGVGTTAMVVAVGFLLAALVTPKPGRRPVAQPGG